MVEHVEELRSETKPYRLGEVKLPLQSHICLPCSETPQHVPTEITLSSCGRGTKRRGIENLPARILRTVKLKRYSGVYVWPGSEGNACGNRCSSNNVHGRGRSSQDKTVERPATQYGMDNFFRYWRGQIVGHAGRE